MRIKLMIKETPTDRRIIYNRKDNDGHRLSVLRNLSIDTRIAVLNKLRKIEDLLKEDKSQDEGIKTIKIKAL